MSQAVFLWRYDGADLYCNGLLRGGCRCFRSARRVADVDRVQAFGALDDVEYDSLPGFQGFITFHLDGGVVGKQVFCLAVLIDETVTLGIVEPFDLAADLAA